MSNNRPRQSTINVGSSDQPFDLTLDEEPETSSLDQLNSQNSNEIQFVSSTIRPFATNNNNNNQRGSYRANIVDLTLIDDEPSSSSPDSGNQHSSSQTTPSSDRLPLFPTRRSSGSYPDPDSDEDDANLPARPSKKSKKRMFRRRDSDSEDLDGSEARAEKSRRRYRRRLGTPEEDDIKSEKSYGSDEFDPDSEDDTPKVRSGRTEIHTLFRFTPYRSREFASPLEFKKRVNFQRMIIMLVLHCLNDISLLSEMGLPRREPFSLRRSMSPLTDPYFAQPWDHLNHTYQVLAERRLRRQNMRNVIDRFPYLERKAFAMRDECDGCNRRHHKCFSYTDSVFTGKRYKEATFISYGPSDVSRTMTLGRICDSATFEAHELRHQVYKTFKSLQTSYFSPMARPPFIQRMLRKRCVNIDRLVKWFEEERVYRTVMDELYDRADTAERRMDGKMPWDEQSDNGDDDDSRGTRRSEDFDEDEDEEEEEGEDEEENRPERNSNRRPAKPSYHRRKHDYRNRKLSIDDDNSRSPRSDRSSSRPSRSSNMHRARALREQIQERRRNTQSPLEGED